MMVEEPIADWDGRYGTITVFVSGHSYSDGNFSTQTTLIDLASGSVVSDLEQFAELVSIYLRQTTEQIENLVSALQSGDAIRVARIAHSCAGASATCGMRRIVPFLRQVEALANDDKLKDVAEVVTQVRGEFNVIKQFLANCPPSAAAA